MIDLSGAGQSVIARYEFKYRIAPAMVAPIRAAVRRFCQSDDASVRAPYVISSLYLDSPRRVLYRHTKERRPRRYKLRIRRYDSGSLYFEVKRREKGVIVKSRVAVDPEHWPAVLLDPRTLGRCRLSPADTRKLQDFLDRSLRIGAEPATVVRYRREAYVSRADDYGRVTFDCQLEALRPQGYEIPIGDEAAWLPFDDPQRFGLPISAVILELKCLTAVPLWMSDLAVRFNLQALGFSKYGGGVETVGGLPFGRDRQRRPAPWVRRSPW
ncbi:MAG: polyphosphate polymerase domain-containing protein [Deltaproteobacteria bacterium]|nr:polyphosphate polymerase domain-containing protein [Deltaproteobacteria bacterium]